MVQPKLKKCHSKDGRFSYNMFYLRCPGKKMKESRLSEIVIEAGVCASWSFDIVMSGKHFNRTLRIYKSNEKAMNRNLGNQKTNPALKTKMGNNQNHK